MGRSGCADYSGRPGGNRGIRGDERELLRNRALYASECTDSTLAILDQLAARGLPNRFLLGGLCSGAYWSLHAALADTRVAGALMINLYAFVWSEALVAERETLGSLHALQGNAWRRLLRRDLKRAQLKTALGSIRPARIRAGAGHPVERAHKEQLEGALSQLRDQGTEALLLLSPASCFTTSLCASVCSPGSSNGPTEGRANPLARSPVPRTVAAAPRSWVGGPDAREGAREDGRSAACAAAVACWLRLQGQSSSC